MFIANYRNLNRFVQAIIIIMKSAFFFIILVPIFILSTGCLKKSPQRKNDSDKAIQSLSNKGSDTMVNLALAWAEEYQRLNPKINISVTGGGTGTGIAALVNATVDIANASREIKSEEKADAMANGVDPLEFIVAKDAIAIIVHPSNPVIELTLQQISDIYSGKINSWNEIGGENRPIVRLSRETNSGTHVYFLEQVLRLGEKDNKTMFSPDTLLLPSSQGITTEVSDNPNAIGYDGLGYVTRAVKMVAVANSDSNSYILPSSATVNDGTYPIARELYMYTDGQPEGIIQDYIIWLFSPGAQEIVDNMGFVPILSQ